MCIDYPRQAEPVEELPVWVSSTIDQPTLYCSYLWEHEDIDTIRRHARACKYCRRRLLESYKAGGDV